MGIVNKGCKELISETDTGYVIKLSGYDLLLNYLRKHKVVDRQKARKELGFTETQLNRYQKQVMKRNKLEIRKNMMRPKHRTLVLLDR